LTLGETELARPVEEVLDHLHRHAIDASHGTLLTSPGPARALLAYCTEKDPCLLVMGAHEHSKFREDFLGGVTTRVLRNTTVPVLLSH
jgi:nucleotide-binding universal stress UspA family protein